MAVSVPYLRPTNRSFGLRAAYPGAVLSVAHSLTGGLKARA